MTPGKDVKVLVVDDNALILDLLMKGLMPHCDARPAADGADALLKIVDDPPDLVVCDYRMPGLDGRQLYEKLRARQQTKLIPFYFSGEPGRYRRKITSHCRRCGRVYIQAVFREGYGAANEESGGSSAA
jgi:PleD family two-component response regulator